MKRGKIHVKKLRKAKISHSKRRFHFTNRTLSQTKEQKRRSGWCEIHTRNDLKKKKRLNKPCAWRQVNRLILLHITWFFKQKLTPSLYQHYPNPFLIKERRKSENLSLKSLFLDVGTTVRHTFPFSELQYLRRGDPRNLC